MTHTFKIKEMTDDSSREKVEGALNAIDGIAAVVTLEPPHAIITMQKHISIEKLQDALSAVGNYTLEMAPN